MFKKIAIAILSVALCFGALAGCAQGEPQQNSEPEAPEYQAIGQKADGSPMVLATNGLEKNVTALFVKQTGDDVFAEDLMAEDQVFLAGETAELYYLTADQTETVPEGATFDVMVTYEDDTTALFEGLDLPEYSDMTLMVNADGIAYVGYVLAADGEAATTEQAAIERKKAAEKALEEEKAAAEAEARAQEAAAASGDQSYYYDAPAASAGGSEDQCVEGGVLLR